MPDAVKTRLEQAVVEETFPGCVFGFVNTLEEKFFLPVGRLTYEVDSPEVTAETVYDTASITKSIPLALIALHFLEQGKLKLDDQIVSYIPEVTIPDAEKGLIKHLLTYTYNLQKNSDPDFSYEHATAKDIFDFLFKREFEYLPGTKYQYANTAANLLGIILERISGEQLYTLAKKHVLDPLQMESSTFDPSHKELVPPTEIVSWRGFVQGVVHDETASILQKEGYNPGCAGLFSNAGDILNVLEMLLNKGERNGVRHFAPETVLQMHTNQLSTIGASSGLGWELNEERFMGIHRRSDTFGKTGFTGTSCVIDPDRGVAFVILSNRTYPVRTNADAINQLRRDISDIVLSTYDHT